MSELAAKLARRRLLNGESSSNSSSNSSSLPSSLPPPPPSSSSSRINNSNSLRFKDGRINEITLIWRKLDKYIDIEGTKTTKQILFNVSGIAKPGEMIALMGPSGSGKTTLLNVLGGRGRANLRGEVYFNNEPFKKSMRRSIAYVLQEDIFYNELTVRQQLTMTSHLRLPDTLTNEMKTQAVNHVIKTLRIEKCADTAILLISGGERKRLCIAIELLSRPKLLFLDEPTSGLDSSTSLSICRALKHLALSGECTVVCTIHQPQQKIFELFDNLILMKLGSIIYQGAAHKSLDYFQAIGKPVPQGENPADHILNVITPAASEHGNRHDDHKFIVPIDLTLGEDKPLVSSGAAVSWFTQFSILFERSLKQYSRRHTIIFMNLTVTLLLATFISQGIWKDIGTDQLSIATRAPSLFFACVTQGVTASLQSVNNFPGERALMLRERQSGAYTVSAYFMAKTITDMLTQLWPPIIFTCIVYPEIGYQPITHKFFIYMFFMILDTMAATSVATAVSCICVSVELTTVVLSGCFEVCRLYGGFFTSPEQLLEYPDWKFADALSYIKYAFVGIALNELNGLELTCTAQEIAKNKCVSSHDIIVQKGYDEYHIDFCAGILVVYIVGFRLLAYLALKYIKV
mmetsp:Transcript_14357/g.15010  ORF Transcript_14357/g.15010 Transcript_14357/m.15010 type:complete len:631 (-) Transcript_14357:213-2105(-)